MPATARHLHAVTTPAPRPAPGSDLGALQRKTEELTERRETIAYQRQHAETTAAMPDVLKDRAHLVARTAYCLKQHSADVTGLLTELARAMYIHGHMDAAAEHWPGLTDATLAAVFSLEAVEARLRAEAEETRHA